MPSKVAVVIPIYKEEIDELEKISLAQCRKVLKNYPLVFVAPEGKKFSYVKPDEILVQFQPHFFKSISTYSQLLMSPIFYERLLDFDYMLIYQLDAFVFYDALEDFCQLGYDYIGAPFPYHVYLGVRPPKTPRVGNGGFSLRRVAACYKILSKCSSLPSWKNIFGKMDEDAFFTCCPLIEGVIFNIAPVEVAKLFSMEWYPARHVKNLGYELPFGCHNWTKLSADFYVELFAQFGYDLRPFRNQMGNSDYDTLPSLLEKLSMERLIRRVERGQSILKYLPKKRFSFVRVIRSQGAMKILSRLLTEDNSLADKIFIYDKKNSQELIQDLTRETLPHLIIALKYDDTPLLEEIEQKGFNYGEHFILFQHEYMKFQEKLFHNLGR